MQTQTQTTAKSLNPIPNVPAKDEVNIGRVVDTPLAPKAPKSITVTLRAGVQEIIAVAYKTKMGWRVEATHYEAKAVKGERRSGKRGATQNFTGEKAKDEAQTALDALVSKLVKLGWARPEPKPLGLERKEDAFSLSALPKPAKK